jgi:ATP-binding cassette subfamily C protein LapB
MSDWNDAALSDTRFAPLLDALVLMTRLYENPYSRDSLVAGLPVENGQLDTQQFIVAAERPFAEASY